MKAIFIISGEKKTGKTLFLQNLISVIADTGFKPKGFFSQHDETTDSYHIKNIQTHERILLLTRTGPPKERPGNNFQMGVTSRSGFLSARIFAYGESRKTNNEINEP